MIPTGVEALDNRLGGLRARGLYAVRGPSAAGKSVLGLHFLISGLERNERTVLITREDPAAIDSRAMFIGYSPGRLTEHPQLRVISLPQGPPASLSIAPPESFSRWLAGQLGDVPSRIVLDADVLNGHLSSLPEIARFFQQSSATTLVMIRSDADRDYAALIEDAAGVFRMEFSARNERMFIFDAAPNGTFRTDPFLYSLRTGAGFTEELSLGTQEIDPSERNKVVVLDEAGALSPEVIARLEPLYDVVHLRSAAGALSELSAGRYGALVVAVDPFDEARAFDLVFALRKEGNAAPIVFVAPSRGLRSTTRARGLRVGGDDFFVADLPPAEIVERIQMTWLRGSHRRSGLSQHGQLVQPVDGSGAIRPMTETEFLQAMQTLLAEPAPPYFCYLEFTLQDSSPQLVWPSLRSRVRLGDGDILGVLSSHRFGCALDRITPEQTWRVVERIRSAHPALQRINDVVVIGSPIHAADIQARLFASRPSLANTA